MEEKCQGERKKPSGPVVKSPAEAEVVTYGEPEEEEEEPVPMTKCGECGKEVSYADGYDNGNYFVCKACG